ISRKFHGRGVAIPGVWDRSPREVESSPVPSPHHLDHRSRPPLLLRLDSRRRGTHLPTVLPHQSDRLLEWVRLDEGLIPLHIDDDPVVTVLDPPRYLGHAVRSRRVIWRSELHYGPDRPRVCGDLLAVGGDHHTVEDRFGRNSAPHPLHERASGNEV